MGDYSFFPRPKEINLGGAVGGGVSSVAGFAADAAECFLGQDDL
jgi:hypothetical protein